MKRICSKCGRSKPSIEFDIVYYETIDGIRRYQYKITCEDCEKK